MKAISSLFFLLMILSLVQAHAAEAPKTLNVAAAADLQFALPELKAEFARANPGIEIQTSVGASGTFAAQIENGAPFDIFLAADSSYTAALAKKGLVQGDPFEYGVGRLVLWSKIASVRDLKGLTDPAVKKIAVANPEHAPYGKAAVAALKAAGLYDSLQPKLVFGENLAQAGQFVQSGASQAGIVSLSLAKGQKARPEDVVTPLGSSIAPPMRQSGAVIKTSHLKERAQAFRAFVLSPAGRRILNRYGIEAPSQP